MEISVIIPTYKRKKQVLETIKSFSNQTCRNFKMVVVDQGPEFISSVELSNLSLPFSVRYLRLDKPSLTKARNAAIRETNEDIVFFCDDDIVPDRFLIEKHIENYKDDRIGGVGGRIIDSGKRKKRISIKSLYPWVGFFNPIDGTPISNFHLDKRCVVKHIKGCNMSFRKEALNKAGLFDECIGGTAVLEDTDMSVRIRRLGYKLLFEPKAVVRHLKLTYGGCQIDDFNDFIYWLYFTDVLIYLRYFKKIFFPFFLARLFFRLLYYILFKMDIRIIGHAKKGFLDAVDKYSKERKGVCR